MLSFQFSRFSAPDSELQVSVGDGTPAGTELSVLEMSLFCTKAGDVTDQPATIASIQPNQISSEGGDTLRLFGNFFDSIPEPSAAVYVQFGSFQTVLGQAIGTTEILCTAPPMALTSFYSKGVQGYFVFVRITNLINFWTNSIQLFVEVPPQALSIFPDSGPSCGGTSVSVFGRNFLPSLSMICVFGDINRSVSSPATWRSPDLVECISPSWSLLDGEDWEVVPLALTGTTSGKESQHLPLTFYFAIPIVVTNISLETGPAETGTNVTVDGVNLSGYSLSCAIGQKTSPIVQVEGNFQCTVPPRGLQGDRIFKVRVVETIGYSGINTVSEKYEVIGDDEITVTAGFDLTSQSRIKFEPGTTVLPMVRGHQYWFDQTDESNFRHSIAFSTLPGGAHVPGREVWTKGVHHNFFFYGSSGYEKVKRDGTEVSVIRFRVPMDAPDVLFMYSETSPGLQNIAIIITDEVPYMPITVIATHGSACYSAAHPFRYEKYYVAH